MGSADNSVGGAAPYGKAVAETCNLIVQYVR